MILEAQANKEAAILRAEAEKEAKIRQAEGEAEAILKVQKATAEGIRLLNEASPTKQVLTMRGFETLEKVADGKATKIIVPSELQNLSAYTSVIKEAAEANEQK